MSPDPDKKSSRRSGRPRRHRSHIRRRSTRPEITEHAREPGGRHSDPTLVEKISGARGDSDSSASSTSKDHVGHRQGLHRLVTNPPPELPEPPLSRPLPPPPPLPAERFSPQRGDIEPENTGGKTTRTDVIAILVLAALVVGMLVVLGSRIVGP